MSEVDAEAAAEWARKVSKAKGTSYTPASRNAAAFILAALSRPADHTGLVEAMERASLIVDRYLYRQSEKVEDVPRILRAAITTLRNPKP